MAIVPIDASSGVAVSMPLIAGGIGIVYVMYLIFRVLSASQGSDKHLIEISVLIRRGANAFLQREYMYIAGFAVIAAITLGIVTEDHWKTSLLFVCGAGISSLTGLIGMYVAVRANVRTAVAAERGLNPALRVAFNSGAVMGFSVVSMGVLGLAVMYVVFDDPELLAAFGFGASSVALFARSGGGIFTKAADVGADLVGKVEAGLPEDDPRNAGTIADNVGDNVGDVAGLGSDLFESYCGSLLAACDLGFRADGIQAIGLAFWISGLGILASLAGSLLVHTREKASQGALLAAMRRGIFSSMGLVVLLSAGGCVVWYGYDERRAWYLFSCIMIGLLAGGSIGYWTEYCTSFEYAPTLSIARSGATGVAPVIIQGLSVGMLSTIFPVVVLSAAVIGTYELAGTFGTAIAAVGMLSTLGITLATDSFGPVSDNAGGIAEMGNMPEYVRERTDALDALGNTTAATGKGFAIASAVLTALALIQAFSEAAGVEEIDLLRPEVLGGVLIGILLPFVFSALTMLAVGTGAQEIIVEVRRQFREIPGLLEGKAKCDPATCVKKCTQSALSEMIIPGVMAISSPIIVGFLLGSEALGGMLFGAIGGGFLLAVFMANSGGAWDNAKKACEAGLLGKNFTKGTDAHKANVEGDCVGDPFKDVSGPSLDVLAKMMAMVSLVLAKLFDDGYENWYYGVVALVVAGLFCFFWYLVKKRGKNAKGLFRYARSKVWAISDKFTGYDRAAAMKKDVDEDFEMSETGELDEEEKAGEVLHPAEDNEEEKGEVENEKEANASDSGSGVAAEEPVEDAALGAAAEGEPAPNDGKVPELTDGVDPDTPADVSPETEPARVVFNVVNVTNP